MNFKKGDEVRLVKCDDLYSNKAGQEGIVTEVYPSSSSSSSFLDVKWTRGKIGNATGLYDWRFELLSNKKNKRTRRFAI